MPRTPPAPLAQILGRLATTEGFTQSLLPDVFFMRASAHYASGPVTYEPSIVIIAQGTKMGRLGTRRFTYDATNYLVLSVPLPFECETFGAVREPMLGISVRVNPATIAELLLEQNAAPQRSEWPLAIDATPLTAEMSDAALRLAKCLCSPVEARILGPQIIREMTYRALCEGQAGALRALASPDGNFGRIARALRRIHSDFAQPLDVGSLAREAGMSASTFHANFKTVTANSPQRYLQTIRLHKAQVLMVSGVSVAESARQVGYESPSQFSREFKRLFRQTPREATDSLRYRLQGPGGVIDVARAASLT